MNKSLYQSFDTATYLLAYYDFRSLLLKWRRRGCWQNTASVSHTYFFAYPSSIVSELVCFFSPNFDFHSPLNHCALWYIERERKEAEPLQYDLLLLSLFTCWPASELVVQPLCFESPRLENVYCSGKKGTLLVDLLCCAAQWYK